MVDNVHSFVLWEVVLRHNFPGWKGDVRQQLVHQERNCDEESSVCCNALLVWVSIAVTVSVACGGKTTMLCYRVVAFTGICIVITTDKA